MRTSGRIRGKIEGYDRAGLDLEHGHLEVKSPSARLTVMPQPDVVIRVDPRGVEHVAWRLNCEAALEPAVGCLFHFVRVDDRSATIEAFVRRWGVLCRDVGVLYAHGDGDRWYSNPRRFAHEFPPGQRNDEALWLVEPVEQYARLARRCRAVMDALVELTAGRPARPDDLTLAMDEPAPSFLPQWSLPEMYTRPEDIVLPPVPARIQDREQVLRLHRRLVATGVSRWISAGHTGTLIEWESGEWGDLTVGGQYDTATWDRAVLRPVYVKEGDGYRLLDETLPRPSRLYDSIAIQLAAAVTSRRGVYRCSNCHQAYVNTKRRPVEGENRYCSDECQTEFHGKDMRDRMARKREQERRKRGNGVER